MELTIEVTKAKMEQLKATDVMGGLIYKSNYAFIFINLLIGLGYTGFGLYKIILDDSSLTDVSWSIGIGVWFLASLFFKYLDIRKDISVGNTQY